MKVSGLDVLDRKFYFDVNDYRTQWIKSGNVTMVTDNPFVGDHDVKIAITAIFYKGNLQLRKMSITLAIFI